MHGSEYDSHQAGKSGSGMYTATGDAVQNQRNYMAWEQGRREASLGAPRSGSSGGGGSVFWVVFVGVFLFIFVVGSHHRPGGAQTQPAQATPSADPAQAVQPSAPVDAQALAPAAADSSAPADSAADPAVAAAAQDCASNFAPRTADDVIADCQKLLGFQNLSEQRSWLGHYSMAEALLASGRYDDAIREYNKALTFNDDDKNATVSSFQGLATAYERRGGPGDYDAAQAQLNNAYQSGGDIGGDFYKERAIVRQKLGDADGAAADLARAGAPPTPN